MKKEKTKETTLVQRIVRGNLIGTLLMGIALTVMCGYFIHTRTNSDYISIARAASTHALSWMEQMDDGDYRYDEASGKLYKGNTEITDDAFWFIQNDNKNMHHTMFWGNTRIMSDITDENGNSVVGTSLSSTEVWDTVKSTGFYVENYVKIAGSEYSVCYVPLKNGDEMVGMIFTGVNQAAAKKLINRDIFYAILITVAYTIFISILFGLLIRKWSRQFHVNLDTAAALAEEKNANVTDFGNQTSETMLQINTAVDQVTIAVTEQASHTEEIMGTMEEFGANIDLIVNNVGNTSDIAQEGISSITNLQNQLNELELVAAENSKGIEEISAQIEEDSKAVAGIAKIIDVINDIAFQITILSYNASVEAAHAGEFGKSFAVVADSIKDLSDKTKESLESIQDIVNDVNAKMDATGESSAKLMTENNKVTEALAHTREKLGDVTVSYEAIINNINTVLDQSETIGVAKNQVVETVSSLAAMGEENAAMSEEMKASSEEVINLTQDLLAEIQTLSEINEILENTKAQFSSGK